MADDRHRQSGQAAPAPAESGIQDVIGRSLKAHFDDILATPMPDRFLVLLSELESREQQMAAGKSTISESPSGEPSTSGSAAGEKTETRDV